MFKFIKFIFSLTFLTINAFAVDICNRPEKIKIKILDAINESNNGGMFKDCSNVSVEDLGGIRELWIEGVTKNSDLTQGDLNGLSGLRRLDIFRFKADSLPNGYLDDLKELRVFEIGNDVNDGVGLINLNSNIFKNNLKLLLVKISGNAFSTLPSDIFSNLPNLLQVTMNGNYKTPFSEEALLKVLPVNIFNNKSIQTVDAYLKFLEKPPKLDVDKLKTCGNNGTIEERANNCNFIKSVKGTDGKFYKWRLIVVSNEGFETWEDTHSKRLWSDLSKTSIRGNGAGVTNYPEHFRCTIKDTESARSRTLNLDQWQLVSPSDIKEAYSRGLFEAVPRFFGDFKRQEVTYLLAGPIVSGYDNGHHGGSFVWMNWSGFDLTELLRRMGSYSELAVNDNYPFLLPLPDRLLYGARSWDASVVYRCISKSSSDKFATY